ncbi:uncharacterized protein LOC132784444 [Drosophila nasuta]|uniref:uncharacterized protein LOC132784444 n=1 Tax=Drosophila nasuta TaxID=42062 RepID=UPI00295EAC77|nr:uncharacterized protein LOC132784444 [Drosophila nasuta]
MTQQSDRDGNNPAVEGNNDLKQFVNNSPVLRIAVYGMSELINTRLSAKALDICLELLGAGVHPKALADVILHTMDAKEKRSGRPFV